MHGGTHEVLRFSELVRFNKNLLLDLSLTICKYRGSSLDMDIKYLFNQFDQRICIGTDYPEFSHVEVRNRFEHFSKGLTKIKKENIAFKNLENFFNDTI